MTGRGGSAGTTVDESGDDPEPPAMLHVPPEKAAEHFEILKRSYLYLRISMVGSVLAIFLAVLFTPVAYKTGDFFLRSISHYYYTPARIVFTGALCAAALALLVISGKGIQSWLLDVAALLAPLIAIIPTPTLTSEVGAAAELDDCVAGWPTKKDAHGERTPLDCIPEDQLGYVEVGIKVWFVFAGLVLAFALVRGIKRYRNLNTRKEITKGYWIVLGAGIAIGILYGVAWWFSPWSEIDLYVLQRFGHLFAAGAFFIIIMIVAVVEAWGQWRKPKPGEPIPQDPPFFKRRTYALWYAVAALILLVDILAAFAIVVIAPPGYWVFLVEVVGLTAFAVFWAFQTAEHCRDADSWETPPPLKIERFDSMKSFLRWMADRDSSKID